MLRRSFLSKNISKPTADVVIVGSGIIGCWTALELARSKKFNKILVVDENPRVGAGSTCYSSGIIRAFYSVQETARLAWESYFIWLNIRDHLQLSAMEEPNVAEMRHVPGWFPIFKDEENSKFIDNFTKVAKELRIPIEHLDAAATKQFAEEVGITELDKKFELRRIEDDEFATPIGMHSDTTSLLVPHTGYVSDPGLATQNVATAAAKAGVQFRCNSRVVSIDKASDGASVTGVRCIAANGDKFSIACPLVINCAGPGSASVTKMAFDGAAAAANDMTLTTRPLRAEVAMVQMPKSAKHNRVITFDCETGFYLRPEGESQYCVGGLDLPSDPIPLDYTHPDETRAAASSVRLPTDEPSQFTPGEQVQIHLYRAAVRMPGLEIPARPRFITSYYDVTEDWQPIIDGSTLPGYYQIIGTSGNCFKIAPLCSRMLLATISGEKTIDLSLSTPPGKSQAFECSVFARNRKPMCDESTNSVIG